MDVGNPQNRPNKETTLYLVKKGKFIYFVNQLESTSNKMCKTSAELILRGDSNVNYPNDNSRKHLLDGSRAEKGLQDGGERRSNPRRRYIGALFE
jgi:hypothetical protein